MTIPFIDLKAQYAALKTSIDARIHTVLDHGQYIMGPEVQELENSLAQYTGAKYCVTCASGTEALLIALMALGVGPGDEVVTTPFTFVATAEVIVLLGATPVFVDIDPSTCNIDPRRIEPAITPKTKALMPVSLYGQPADMDAINAIAGRYGLPVVEDAAQSFGATYRGKKSCNLSTIGCTSFFPSKPLGCYGDGGAMFTSDETLARAMREIRIHGQEKRYQHTRVGVGGRMDTLQCAVVLGKLERFDWEVRRRQEIGERYGRLLDGFVDTVHQSPDCTSVFAQYTIFSSQRERLQAFLKETGIPTAVHYPIPLHLQPAYKNNVRCVGSLAVSERMAACVLSLPMSPYLSEADQDRVVAVVRDSSTVS